MSKFEVRELLANGEKFPVDVAAVPTADESPAPFATKISAYDFSRGYSRTLHFGAGSVPAALRALADKIENKQILSHRVQVITEARQEDYTKSALILEYTETNLEPAEKLPPCPERS